MRVELLFDPSETGIKYGAYQVGAQYFALVLLHLGFGQVHSVRNTLDLLAIRLT